MIEALYSTTVYRNGVECLRYEVKDKTMFELGEKNPLINWLEQVYVEKEYKKDRRVMVYVIPADAFKSGMEKALP